MSGRIDARLRELNLTLPKPAQAQGAYVPWVRTGSLLFVSGQITLDASGLRYVGLVGREFDIDGGKAAARLAALNVIAQAKAALGDDLDRVTQVVKVTGFVNAGPGFTQHPEVVNGASDLFTEIFGDRGRHARAAVGCSSLPRNVAVEIDAIFEIA